MRSHSVAKKLGRYEIIKHLAQGGMADVLLARTSGIEGFARHVVLKRIRAEQAHDERYVSMFLDEARLAATLHHHNIVQVTDIGEEDGEYFFTMEYIHGEDTRALLANVSRNEQQVPLEHALAIVCAAAAGLHHAHEQRATDRSSLGIVHRDVSPANILIGYDGGVKVADFGIAKAAHRTTETRSGTLKGKVAYMSPEQCVGEAVDRRSDVFALGIVLYELLTVRRLFKGDNDFMTMTAIVLGYIPPPSTIRTDLPAELEDIVLKALATKPEDRYASAQDLRLALEQLANRLQLSMSSTALADYMTQTFGTRPEPWLDEDDDPEMTIGIDFDGSASGVVRVPVDSLPPVETLRMIATGSRPVAAPNVIAEPPSEVIELVPKIAPATLAGIGVPPVEPKAHVRAGRSPIEHVGGARRGRFRMIVGTIALLASLCAFAAAFWMSRDPAPTPTLVPVSRPAVTPVPAPKLEPAPRPQPVVVPEVAPAAKPQPKKPKPTPPPKQKRWDPNALFIE